MLAVVVTPRAASEIQAALEWWRENRSAPELLETELTSVLAIVAATPMLGAVARDVRLAGVRRTLLRRTQYHLYYRADPAAGNLEVLAVWHARRRSPSL